MEKYGFLNGLISVGENFISVFQDENTYHPLEKLLSHIYRSVTTHLVKRRVRIALDIIRIVIASHKFRVILNFEPDNFPPDQNEKKEVF